MPRISILMPIFNGAEYLHRSITSVVNQTFDDWQLVVLNDGSTDTSAAILQSFAETDCRILLLNKINDGKGYVAANLLFMYPHAKGDYFFYMSQDDELSRDCLEQLINRVDETEADVVIPNMILRYEDGSEGTWPCSYPPDNDYEKVLSGHEAFYLASDFSINGFALIRAGLMKDSRCDTQWFNSDEYNTRLQYLWAKRITFSHGTFYYNLGNANAVTAKFSTKRFESLRTVLMLEKVFNETFPDKRRRLKMKRESFGTYVAMLILYANNIRSIKKTENNIIQGHIRFYESNESFKGYRKALLGILPFHEWVFALCFLVFGSRKLGILVYLTWHNVKQTFLNTSKMVGELFRHK